MYDFIQVFSDLIEMMSVPQIDNALTLLASLRFKHFLAPIFITQNHSYALSYLRLICAGSIPSLMQAKLNLGELGFHLILSTCL